MRGRVVRIGNSQGIRIPKPLLEQSGIKEDVEIEVQNNQIIIRSVSVARAGWDAAFQRMAENSDDARLEGEVAVSHSWDETEWQW